jgi:hypothetical protein
MYKSSVGPCFGKQIMPILLILCYNGSLVTWTVVSLTTAKFKPHMFSLWTHLIFCCEHGHLQRQSQSYVTTYNKSASLSRCQALIWGPRADFYYCQTVAGLLMCGERAGLSFTIAAGSNQRSHLRIRVLRGSWPYFTVSDSRFLQSWGPGRRIYIPQEQGGPVILSGTGFPFHRLLRLAGPRVRPHRNHCLEQLLYCCMFFRCLAMTRLFEDVGACLLYHCLATDDFSC